MVREFVEDAPTQLLGDKVLYIGVLRNLRQLRAVSKSVWQEEDLWLHPKFLFEELLTVQELTRH